MNEVIVSQTESRRRIHLTWVLPVLFRPRSAFEKITGQAGSVWLTPMLILSLAIMVQVLVAGPIKQAAAQGGAAALPKDFQYYSPDQQAQFMQAQQATSSPVFVYVFPAITGLAGIWAGWLLVSGLIHLILTLIGGRGDTGAAFNLVAWSGLPYALRALVRAGYMLAAHQLITSPGLTGFVSPEHAYLAQFLGLVDIYVIWNIVLLVIGVRVGMGLRLGKALASVFFTVILVLATQALLGYLAGRFGSLTVIRPFF
jgi:hypothetical protein